MYNVYKKIPDSNSGYVINFIFATSYYKIMNKSKLEYIWLDGYKPTANLRSKTKVVSDFSGKLEDVEMWSFDGSSTLQAEGGSSDCLLKPVAI
jgi:glutamine synthetase